MVDPWSYYCVLSYTFTVTLCILPVLNGSVGLSRNMLPGQACCITASSDGTH